MRSISEQKSPKFSFDFIHQWNLAVIPLPGRKAWIWCFILDYACAFYLTFFLPTLARPMSMRKKELDGPQGPRQRRDEAAPMTTTPIVEDRCQSLRYHHRHPTPCIAPALELRPPNDNDVVSPNDSPQDRHRRCRLPATPAAVVAQQNDRHMDSPAALSPKRTILGSMALSMMYCLLVSFASDSVLTLSNFGLFLLYSGLSRIIGKRQRQVE
jgi:hypothetical protein